MESQMLTSDECAAMLRISKRQLRRLNFMSAWCNGNTSPDTALPTIAEIQSCVWREACSIHAALTSAPRYGASISPLAGMSRPDCRPKSRPMSEPIGKLSPGGVPSNLRGLHYPIQPHHKAPSKSLAGS